MEPIANTPAREPNNFCEVAGQKCYMNYCDENGCQDRKRRYTAFGVSLLHNEDLLKHLLENLANQEQVELVAAEMTTRFAALRETLAAPAAPVAGSSKLLADCPYDTPVEALHEGGWTKAIRWQAPVDGDPSRMEWFFSPYPGDGEAFEQGSVTEWKPLCAAPVAGSGETGENPLPIVAEVLSDWFDEVGPENDYTEEQAAILFGLLGTAGYSIVPNAMLAAAPVSATTKGAGGWVSVEDRLPEMMPDEWVGIEPEDEEEIKQANRQSEDVLICRTVQTPMNKPYEAVKLARYFPGSHKGKGAWLEADSANWVWPHHWMPLPTAPKTPTGTPA